MNWLERRPCFKEKWKISMVNNPKTKRIKNVQFRRYCFYMIIFVAQLRPTLWKVLLKGLAKLAYHALVSGIVKNLII